MAKKIQLDKYTQELIDFVIEHKDVADECLRELAYDVLTKIKELNAKKIDMDLEGLKNGTPFDELFNNKEITLDLYEQDKILILLINIAKKGIAETFIKLKELDENKTADENFVKFLGSVVGMYYRYVQEKVELLNGKTTNNGGVN